MGIRHVQVFALKPGIIKANREMEGIILKGIGADFDWEFLKNYLVEGKPMDLKGDGISDGIPMPETIRQKLPQIFRLAGVAGTSTR
ncbi:MAG: hypothetical protein IPJ00_21605 [Saprospirales bacterium]|nr:hypothetical protein [Saprospirales bacterium]